ncbi:hypothetical protein LEMLEM_LOCUS23767 [Lemmus lemmus]
MISALICLSRGLRWGWSEHSGPTSQEAAHLSECMSETVHLTKCQACSENKTFRDLQ